MVEEWPIGGPTVARKGAALPAPCSIRVAAVYSEAMLLKTEDTRKLRVLHIGGYWRGENDIVREMMLGLQSAGLAVLEYDTRTNMPTRWIPTACPIIAASTARSG